MDQIQQRLAAAFSDNAPKKAQAVPAEVITRQARQANRIDPEEATLSRSEKAIPLGLAGAEPLATGRNAALALALLRILPDSVFLLDPDGRVTFMNRAALRNQSAARENGQGAQKPDRDWWSYWPEADENLLRQALADACDGEASDFTAICPGACGTGQRHLVTVAPIEDLDGSIGKVLCIARQEA